MKKQDESIAAKKNFVELVTPKTLYRYNPPTIRLGAVQATFIQLLQPIYDLIGEKNLRSLLNSK